MKKKVVIFFGTLALIAVLSLNVNVSKSHDLKTFSLKNLLSLSEAQSEGPGGGGCEVWCYHADYYTCYLNIPQGTLVCHHQYPW